MYSVDGTAAIVKRLREHAAAIGCDALVIVGSADTVAGQVNAFGGSVQTLKGFRGTCIVYRKRKAKPRKPDPEPPEEEAEEEVASSDMVCTPNETQLCNGPGACQGAQYCLPDGSGLSPCDCGSKPEAPASAQ